jgi:hypothetical protein
MGLIAWVRRLFCRHEWRLEVIGMFDEENVRCRKCGALNPTYDESDE